MPSPKKEQATGVKYGGTAGFTLLEITIVSGIVAIAAMLMYGVVGSLYKSWVSEGLRADMRQNARVALDTTTRDIEMTGYQITKYGDDNKANLAITLAAADEIEMDQQKLDIADGSYEPRMLYYHLAVDATTGRKNLYRQARFQPGLAAPDEIVAENVSVFTISYFDVDGAAVTGLPAAYVFGNPPPQALRDIRRICVSVTATTERPPPSGKPSPSLELSTCITPRNLSVEETILDRAPPSVPASLSVVDTGSCTDKLCVRWDRNPETDLAGYVLYYGAGFQTVPVGALADPASPRRLLNPADLLITKKANRVGSPNTYAISIAAYDSSGNYSGRSAPVSGNPVEGEDVSDCVNGTGDTTVNPVNPSPPLNLAVTPGGEGELVITWDSPADGSASAGYRLYRSDAPFSDGATIGTALLIADETTLGSVTTTYSDAGLIGCQDRYYAVASINCDETLASYYVFQAGGGGDYAANDGRPADITPPPPVSLEGTTAGWQRIFVALQNPIAEEVDDFSHTEIYFSEGVSCPTLTPGGNVSGGSLLPDSDSGTPGTFVNPGSQTVIFANESSAADDPPMLTNQANYCLLSVAYDVCGNTATDSSSLALINLCGDDPPGPPPEWPINPTYSSCAPAWVKLGWEYLPKYYTGVDQVFDFAGYRIWRAADGGAEIELTQGPTWNESWTDGKDLQEGGRYRYTVRATDCVYENDHDNFPMNYSTALFIPSASTWISPGRLVPYGGNPAAPLAPENFVTSFSDAGEPYTYHNNVRFFLQSTSSGTMTIEDMRISWINPNVVLHSIIIGGPLINTALTVVPAGNVPAGTSVAVNTQIVDTAIGIGQPSVPVPVVFRFTNADGTVNRFTDMRSEEIVVSSRARNNTLMQSTCDPEVYVIDVPQGPILGGFAQDWPQPFGTGCYEVVGRTGSARDDDIRVPALVEVNVTGLAFDNSAPFFSGTGQGFDTLSLFAHSDPVTAPESTPTLPTGVTFAEMPLQQVSGNQYAIYDESNGSGAKMPLTEDLVNWYYLLAVDKTGNFDRFPNPDFGACAYYQKPVDSCLSRPKPPVLDGVSSPTAVNLSWTAPDEYVDGGGIPLSDALAYDVFLSTDGGVFTLLAGDVSGLTYSHSADITAADFAYAVSVKNSCLDGPLESDRSNIFRECEGASDVDCGAIAVPSSVVLEQPFSISARNICFYAFNGTPDIATYRLSSSRETKEITVNETGDVGSFQMSVTATTCVSDPVAILAMDIANNDTVVPLVSTACFPSSGTVRIGNEEMTYSGIAGGYLLGVVRGVSGNPVRHKAGRAVELVSGGGGIMVRADQGDTVTVDFITDDGVVQCTNEVLITDPCTETPEPPDPFNVIRSSGNEVATLTWGMPLYNTDGSPALDLGGYEIEARRCKDPTASNCTDWSPWEGINIPDPGITSHTITGLQSTRTGFRIRVYDTCRPTPNYSNWTDVVRK